jgi:hypothetical protein
MAKVLEGPGMGLLRKWGISTPNYVVVTSNEEFEEISKVNDWLQKSKLVVKAHEALGSRFKLGLVKVGLDLAASKSAVKEMLGKHLESLTIREVIVSTASNQNGNATPFDVWHIFAVNHRQWAQRTRPNAIDRGESEAPIFSRLPGLDVQSVFKLLHNAG